MVTQEPAPQLRSSSFPSPALGDATRPRRAPDRPVGVPHAPGLRNGAPRLKENPRPVRAGGVVVRTSRLTPLTGRGPRYLAGRAGLTRQRRLRPTNLLLGLAIEARALESVSPRGVRRHLRRLAVRPLRTKHRRRAHQMPALRCLPSRRDAVLPKELILDLSVGQRLGFSPTRYAPCAPRPPPPALTCASVNPLTPAPTTRL